MKTIETKTLKGTSITISVSHKKTVVTMPWKNGQLINVEVSRQNVQTPAGILDMLIGQYRGEKCGCSVAPSVHDEIAQIKRDIVETSCPGYSELKEQEETLERLTDKSHAAIVSMMETGKAEAVSYQQEAEDLKALRAKYPRAAALLRAQDMQYKSNDKAVTAGYEAEKLLIEGGSIEEAAAIMNNW